MGLAERKEREKADMKRQILDAARSLFLEEGFEKTSIRNIAEAIEYSPATIYLYFKDKNEIFFALHCEAFIGLINEMQVVLNIQEPFERLVELGRRYFKFAYENPELYELMFVMTAPIETLECREEMWDDGKNAFGLLSLVVAECQKVGYFKDKDVINTSLMIWSFVHGLVMLHTRRRMSFFEITEREDRQEDAFTIFVEMLRKL
jgi:AcrR family transcriptional regulator